MPDDIPRLSALPLHERTGISPSDVAKGRYKRTESLASSHPSLFHVSEPAIAVVCFVFFPSGPMPMPDSYEHNNLQHLGGVSLNLVQDQHLL